MLNNILSFIFSVFAKFNSFILSLILIPLSNAIYIFFPISNVFLFTQASNLFQRVLNVLSFFSIIIRQLTCINSGIFAILLTFFMGKISILLLKVSFKFIIAVLGIFHINLPYYFQEHNQIGFKTK